MAEPSVTINYWKKRILVIPTFAPGSGTYVSKGPVFEVDPGNQTEIGAAVIAGLAEFEDSGPWPIDWNTYPSAALIYTKSRNWAEYNRALRDEALVSQEADRFHIFTSRPHIYLPLNTEHQLIGKSVLQALGIFDD